MYFWLQNIPRDILSDVASLFNQKDTQDITTRRIQGPYTYKKKIYFLSFIFHFGLQNWNEYPTCITKSPICLCKWKLTRRVEKEPKYICWHGDKFMNSVSTTDIIIICFTFTSCRCFIPSWCWYQVKLREFHVTSNVHTATWEYIFLSKCHYHCSMLIAHFLIGNLLLINWWNKNLKIDWKPQ